MNTYITDHNIKYTVSLVHISDIASGDTIEHEGILKTVGKSNIIRDNDLGTRIFGDSYQLGRKLVKKVNIVHQDLLQLRVYK